MNEEKSWAGSSVIIANSLKAWPVLTVIRFYFGKKSTQRVFLALGSNCLIKLLETTKCITPGADQSFGKQPDKSSKNKWRNSHSRLISFEIWMGRPATVAAVQTGQGRPWQEEDGRKRMSPCCFLLLTSSLLLFKTTTIQRST